MSASRPQCRNYNNVVFCVSVFMLHPLSTSFVVGLGFWVDWLCVMLLLLFWSVKISKRCLFVDAANGWIADMFDSVHEFCSFATTAHFAFAALADCSSSHRAVSLGWLLLLE